jgi:P27 family predicted phage terminase small subunit
MGLRGPKSAPTVIRLLRGERRPSRVNRDEPDLPPPASLAPPVKLTGPGRLEWLRLADTLAARGVLTDADLSAFEDYCRALSDLRRVEDKAKRVGIERAIAAGLQNAAVKLRGQVAQLRAALGLTPSSRASVKRAGPSMPAKSRLEQFKLTKGGAA